MTVHTASWIDHFEGLSRLDEDLRRTLIARSRVVDLPEGTVIFGPGKAPQNMAALIAGILVTRAVLTRRAAAHPRAASQTA